MADELIDIYDENNEPTGEKQMKSEAHRLGLWHRVAHVWIYNQKGEILLQLRAKDKLLYPNMWDISAAGHISAGEDAIVSAVRETQEEIGLEISLNDLKFFKIKKHSAIYQNIKNNEFFYIYFLQYDDSINILKKQEEEVADLKFLSLIEVEEGLKNSPDDFAPHGDYWPEIISQVKKLIGK